MINCAPVSKGYLEALIIDRRAVMATEMCRALAKNGFIVSIVGDSASPAFHSRFCAQRFIAPSGKIAETYPDLVRHILKAKSYDAIFICNEEVLEALLSLPDFLDSPGLVMSAEDSLKKALSKRAMLQVASDAGLTTPRTIAPSNAAELRQAALELGFPLIVKGDRGESGNHVRLVRQAADLIHSYQEVALLENSGEFGPVLQEYIQGEAYSVGGLFFRGKPLRVCAHRKLVAVPPLGGLTVKGLTESCPELLEAAFKIFAALSYTGLGHVELIRDSAKRFQFLEINPRAWGTIGIGALAGVDFFTPYAQLAAGVIPDPDLRFREGVKFHRLSREAKMLRVQPARLPGLIADCCNPAVRSDFTWSDPMPHVATFGGRILKTLVMKLALDNINIAE